MIMLQRVELTRCALMRARRSGRVLRADRREDVEPPRTVYRLSNVAADPLVAYEAAPEELFAAQRLMRERGEQLLGIYHSHPRSRDPLPSETDVRLAYYPSAVYFIIGLSAGCAHLRAFRISEREGHWEHVEYTVAGGE